MSWHTGRMVGFDLESTGTDPHRDRIVTAAIVEVGGGQETRGRSWLVNPGIPVPPEATEVHGITDEQAQHGADPAEVIPVAAAHLIAASRAGTPIVGHNVGGYDLTMLIAECIRHGHDQLASDVARIQPVIDTMILERHLDPFRPGTPETAKGRRPDEHVGNHRLETCARLWGVALDGAHDATEDALAACRLAWRLATDPYRFEQYDGHRGLERINPAQWPLDRLHAWQAEQYATEAARFESYMRGEQRRKPDEVDPTFSKSRDWPVQAPAADWTPAQLPVAREAVPA